jgi:hypothetical protein
VAEAYIVHWEVSSATHVLVIGAFCIIIFASYMSIYCYLHYSFIIHALLDDFLEFPTKSPLDI